METLPPEILLYITSYLTLYDFSRLSQVCKYFNSVYGSEFLKILSSLPWFLRIEFYRDLDHHIIPASANLYIGNPNPKTILCYLDDGFTENKKFRYYRRYCLIRYGITSHIYEDLQSLGSSIKIRLNRGYRPIIEGFVQSRHSTNKDIPVNICFGHIHSQLSDFRLLRDPFVVYRPVHIKSLYFQNESQGSGFLPLSVDLHSSHILLAL